MDHDKTYVETLAIKCEIVDLKNILYKSKINKKILVV